MRYSPSWIGQESFLHRCGPVYAFIHAFVYAFLDELFCPNCSYNNAFIYGEIDSIQKYSNIDDSLRFIVNDA